MLTGARGRTVAKERGQGGSNHERRGLLSTVRREKSATYQGTPIKQQWIWMQRGLKGSQEMDGFQVEMAAKFS